ncbi:hypothetical protein P389DRAFT_175 [Cystobasidium minutum MCA 4210]|uniref:uncharacterized protein n=1 Tax=Cystobasidium minutum MCA 4210 TaxID=1397322 RepID=UPI0034CD80F4|eukprot:jgi/Rhomi1/175/CE174_341
MGQAYLEHSIAELESQLREARLKPSSSSSSSKSKDKSKAPCLLDVSMLVYALPVVRKWARSDDYAELLLPIDALAMLDILKKADQPICSQAREAIRWLERQLSMHEEDRSGPYNSNNGASRNKKRSKLRILNDEDLLTWSQVLPKSCCRHARLDDPDSAESVDDTKDLLLSTSLATQASLRAFLALEQSSKSSTILAVASSESSLALQPNITKRVLLDQTPLETILSLHFPSISTTSIIRISPDEISEAVEADARFRQALHARREEKSNASTFQDGHRTKHDRVHKRLDSGYYQNRSRSPQSQPFSDRSPARSADCRASDVTNEPSAFWNEPPPLAQHRQTQPRLLQRRAPSSPRPTSSTHASTGSARSNAPCIGSRQPLFNASVSSNVPPITAAAAKPTSAPKIMLANPRSTARSLSTAT